MSSGKGRIKEKSTEVSPFGRGAAEGGGEGTLNDTCRKAGDIIKFEKE